MREEIQQGKQEIQDYLMSGGLNNPELADHEEVRDLIIRLRTLLESIEERLK